MELNSTTPIILTSFIFIFLTSLIFTGIAYLEKGKKERKLFEDSSNLIYSAIGLYIFIVILLLILELKLNIQINSTLMLFIISIIKLIIASYIANIAKKQNRNSTLWFILGFLEFHAAFIALGIGKSIYKVPVKNKFLFNELKKDTEEKVSSLNEITSNIRKSADSVTLQREYTIPLIKIKREYFSKFNKLIEQSLNEENIKKYERAYKAGIISEDEYNSKISKLEKP